MRFMRRAAATLCLCALVVWLREPPARATNHDVLINEVMAGANGDSRVQFIEIVQLFFGQNCWGPQVPPATPGADGTDDDCLLGPAETSSRAMLVFFDAQDREIGRYKFPENPPTGFPAITTLIATEAFANLPGAPVPDLIMPPLLSPVSGKVCMRENPDNRAHFDVNLCVSYGAFAGTPGLEGPPAPALSIVGTQSLQRSSGNTNNQNSAFALATASPRNVAGETFALPVVSQIIQGEALFKNETFMGNGRTCAQCHIADDSFRLTPANVQTRFANLANTFETQFIAEPNLNLNTLVLTARPTHQSGTDFNNISGGDLQGIITGSGGGRGRVAARVGPLTYLVIGGISPPLAGTVTDAFGNSALVTSITTGGLNALEVPARMRTSLSLFFPAGRALILENIDGFANPPVFRKSPHLLNLNRTAPYGFSGDVADLRTFATNAVIQHLPRTLARTSASAPGSAPDFRLPTAGELAAIEAFMNANEFPSGNDPDKFDLDRFVTTDAQRRGRELFFGPAKCSQCHGGPVLAQTTVSIQGKPIGQNVAFNTGVMNQPINLAAIDNLPCEPSVGVCNSREFSTPQLFNVNNLGPWFHDGSAHTLTAAVEFYDSDPFNNSPAGIAIGGIQLVPPEVTDIVAFLEAISPAPHAITNLNNTSTQEDVATPALAFTVSPPEVTLSGTSSNTTLIPNGNIVFSGTGVNRSVVITPAPNQFGTATITVNASSPTGAAVRAFQLTVNSINDPPTISAIANVTIDEDSGSRDIALVVGDIDTPLANLNVSHVTTNGVLNTIAFSGTGTNRTMSLTPLRDQFGTADITVFVSDGTLNGRQTFTLTVTNVNDPPEIVPIADRNVVAGTTAIGPLLVTLSDIDTAAAMLTLIATSSNQALVPNANIVVAGSGASRSIMLFPLPDAIGITTIAMVAGDGSLFTERTFNVTIAPSSPAPPAPPPPGVLPPGAPSGLAATVRGTAIDLTWLAAPADADQISEADAATGYRIEVGSRPGLGDVSVFTTGVSTAFTVTGLGAGTYYIRVRAFNDGGSSNPSNEVVVSLARGVPRNLQSTVIGQTVQLSWLPPDDGTAVSGYLVEVGSTSGAANLATVPVAVPAIAVDGVANGTYFVRVKAVTPTGLGGASNEVIVTVGGPPLPCAAGPTPPRNLSATVTGTIVQISWIAPAAGAPISGYAIHVGAGPGLSNVATIPLDGSLTSITSPAPNGTYFIRLTAANACGVSTPSNEAAFTVGASPTPPVPPTAPGAPNNLTAQVAGTQVTLTWAAPVSGGPPARYIIDVTDVANNPVISVDTGSPATSFSHTGAPAGVFVVRVRAANAGGIGPPSGAVTLTITP